MPGEIAQRVPFHVQNERLLPAREPDLAGHPPANAAVDLASDDMICKTPSHEIQVGP